MRIPISEEKLCIKFWRGTCYDDKIMDTRTFRRPENDNIIMGSKLMVKPRQLNMAASLLSGGAAGMTEMKTVMVYVSSNVSHGTDLYLRNMRCLVLEQNMAHKFTYRRLMQALGLDDRKFLATALDRVNRTF